MARAEMAAARQSERESLVQRVTEMFSREAEETASRPLGRPELPAERWDPAAGEAGPLPDGYLRRSPVQAYRTPAGYRMRCIRKAAALLLLLALAALVTVAAIRSNFFGLAAQ